MPEEDLPGCCGHCFHPGDDPLEESPVGDPTAVELGLALVESAADGLALDGSAPLVVGPVALGRVGLASAARFAAAGLADYEAARADEVDLGELGGE